MNKQNKINFFGFSINNWYRHSRNLNHAQKGELIEAVIAFMERDTCTIVDTVVLQRFNEIQDDLVFMRDRAEHLKEVNTQNIKKRWENHTVVLQSKNDCIYDGYTNVNVNVNDNYNVNVNEKKENTTPTSQQVARSKEAIRTTQLLYDSIMANVNPTRYRNNPPKLEVWSKDIELLHTKDGVPYELIDKVILWATSDDFWRANILSGSNLRKKFTTLEAKMKQPSRERKQATASDIAEYIRLTEDKK